MTNLKILIKNNFNLLIGKFRNRSKRKSPDAAGSILIVTLIGLLALYSLQAWTMYDGLAQFGLGKLCMYHACITTLTVLLILGIMRASVSDKSSDHDFLMALPIKKSDIVISKTVSKYIYDFFFVLMLFMPFLIIYQIRCELNIQVLITGLILAFTLPLMSIGISYILDFTFSRLFNRSRFSSLLKSITTTFIFIFVLIIMLVVTSTYGLVGNYNLNEYFAKRPISNLLLNFMFQTSILNTLLVIMLTIAPFILGLFCYATSLSKSKVTYQSTKKTLKFTTPKSPLKLLFKKELYKYASTTAYIVNTSIGAILMIVLAVFISSTGLNGIYELFGGIQIPKFLIVGILTLVLCGSSSTILITAPSISLEGKNIWFLKSTPISTKDIFLSKLLLHLTIVAPCSILASFLLSISLKFTLLEFLIILIIPLIHLSIMAVSGLLLNLWLPNFHWDNETQLVKNSLPVLLGMALGMLLTAGILGLYLLLKHLEIWLIFIIITSILFLILATLTSLTFTVGKKLFNKL